VFEQMRIVNLIYDNEFEVVLFDVEFEMIKFILEKILNEKRFGVMIKLDLD